MAGRRQAPGQSAPHEEDFGGDEHDDANHRGSMDAEPR
jgi:hypothetical protein